MVEYRKITRKVNYRQPVVSQDPYHGLTQGDAVKKSDTMYGIATQHEVPFTDVERRSQDIDDINIHEILTQPAPPIPGTRSFGQSYRVKGLVVKERPRTELETIAFNMSKVPDTPRAKYMAKQYLRQWKHRKKVEAERIADLGDVLDFNMYLAYFIGGKDAAEAIGKANLFRNKPNLADASDNTIGYLAESPNESYVPSAFNVALDQRRSDEIDMLVQLGDAKKRDKYYQSKGRIGFSKFQERKDTREYMIFSDVLKAIKSAEIRNAINRLQDPENSYATSQFTTHGLSPNYDRDLLLMRDHFFNLEESQARGISLTANLTDMGLNMFKYMGEIALLTGITTSVAGGKAVGLRAAAKLNKLGVPKVLAANLGKLSTATSMALVDPAGVSSLTIARMTDKGYVGDIGEFIKTDEGQAIMNALPKSVAERSLTFFIEQKGDDIAKGLFRIGSKATSKLPRGLVSQLDEVAEFMKRTGTRSFDKLPKKMQGIVTTLKGYAKALVKAGKFDGVFGENVEEYIEQIVKPMLLLDDQYRDKDDAFIDRVAKSLVPDPEQVILQTILFTAIPFAAGAIGSVPATVNWAGRKAGDVIQGQPTLPEVKRRIDLENSLAVEYGLDRKQAFEVADMLDRRIGVDKIQKYIQGFGGDLTNFRFSDHNNTKALAAMLVDRGLVPEEALRLAEIVTQKAGEEDAAIQDIVESQDFKNDVERVEKVDLFGGILEEAQKAGDTTTENAILSIGIPTGQNGIDDAAEQVEGTGDVTGTLQRLQAESEAKQKIANRTPLDSAEREQFPELARQEDQIAKLRATDLRTLPEAPPTAGHQRGSGDFVATQKTKRRGVSESVEAEAIKNDLIKSFENVPEYQVVSMEEQGKLVGRIIVNNPDQARRIAMGQEAAPPGVIPEMVYIAVANKATHEGDINTLTDLALNSELIKEATEMGQRIRAYGELGEQSPIKAIQSIRNEREKALKRNEKATRKKLRKELNKAEKNLVISEKKLSDSDIDVIISETTAGIEVVPSVDIKSKVYGANNKIVTKTKADAALKRLGDTTKLFAGVDPQKIADVLEVSIFHLEATGRNFAEWTKNMVAQFGNSVKPHLKKLWKQAGDKLAAGDKESSLKAIQKGIKEDKDIRDFSFQIQKLAKALIVQGFDTRTKLVNAMQKELADIFPDATKRDVADAISGFGQFKLLSTGFVNETLRAIKGQLQQLSKLADIAAGKVPSKTGIEQRTIKAEERVLRKQVTEALKKSGLKTTDPVRQLKTALDAIKTRLKNQIEDLEKQIKERQKIVKTKTPSPTDAEVEALKTQRDALRVEFDELFGKNKLTDAQRIARAKARLQSDISKLNERIEKGDFSKEIRRATPDTIEIKTLRYARDKAKRVVASAREILEQGGGISKEEVNQIMLLSQAIEFRRLQMEAGQRRPTHGRPTETEMEYGLAVVAFEKYIEALQHKAQKKALPQRLKGWLDIRTGDLLLGMAGTAKAVLASFDNSFIGRQGVKLFYLGITGDFRAGKIWMDTFMRSFKVIAGSFAGKNVMDILRAEILSDPQYDLMRRAKVATAVVEEEFPVHWPGRIPVIGQVFKASEEAFTASAYYMRYKTAKMYFDIAHKTGVNLNDKFELESIGRLVNALTARGGKAAQGSSNVFLNNVIWSPKMIKANFEVFFLMPLNVGRKDADGRRPFSKFAQKQAARNLWRIILGQAAILFIAKLIYPESVEDDPTSSDFGKIKIGNTRFDISGGSTSMMVLAMRIAQNRYKGGSGLSKPINTGDYGGLDSSELVFNFLQNKLSPAASSIKEMINRRTFRGDPVTPATIAEGLLVPLPLSNLKEMMEDPDSAPVLLGMMLEVLGVSTLTYETRRRATR